MSRELYLGVDMGGTHIKIAIVGSQGNIVEEAVIDTDAKEKPLNVIKTIIDKSVKLNNYRMIKSVGIGMAGDVDYNSGIVRFSPNLSKWKKVPLKKIFEQISHKKTYVDNDANTAAIGAFWLEAKRKIDNLICVTIGTGVGGGIIFNKKLYRGTSGTAGEIGHITIEANGQKCKCGNYGCIETFVGAKYLSMRAQKYLENNNSKIIDELTNKKRSPITPHILFLAADRGDKIAKEIWSAAGKNLGIFFTTLINFANPDMIVLCGGISKAGKYFIKSAVEEIQRRAFKSAVKICKIKLSQYEHKLGVVGAAMLAKQ